MSDEIGGVAERRLGGKGIGARVGGVRGGRGGGKGE